MLLVLVQFLVSFAYIYWHSYWFTTVITISIWIVFSVSMLYGSSRVNSLS
jgi:hypothetical protein